MQNVLVSHAQCVQVYLRDVADVHEASAAPGKGRVNHDDDIVEGIVLIQRASSRSRASRSKRKRASFNGGLLPRGMKIQRSRTARLDPM